MDRIGKMVGADKVALPAYLRVNGNRKRDFRDCGKPNPLTPPCQGDLSLNSPLIRGARGVRKDECWGFLQSLESRNPVKSIFLSKPSRHSQFSIFNYQLPASIAREWANNSVCIKVQVWLLMRSPLIHTISSNL